MVWKLISQKSRWVTSAGYNAIEFTQVGTEVDDAGQPIEGTGFPAPLMIDDKCVGCGLCQTRCYGINVSQKKLLDASAIVIKAGTGISVASFAKTTGFWRSRA
jgi:NAD-dependent dihydropyrimidine dehydrogenase PreA subunit